MALDFLSESPSDLAESKAMQAGEPPPEPSKPAPAPEPAKPAAEPAKPAEPVVDPAKPAAEPAKAADERPKFVPHAALHEERLKRQELERELATLRAGKPAAPEPAAEIDPETDPIGALKEIRAHQAEQRELAKQETQLREFDGRIQAHEADWSAANPDYGEQVAFLREFRAGQLKALFPGITNAQLGQQLMKEARETAYYAFQNGKNPGEVFSDLAKHSGWKAKEAAAAAVAAAQPAAPEPIVDLEAKRAESNAALDRISRGQKAGRATAGAGGNAPEPEMTMEKLASLTGAAFDAAMEKHGKRLFGG